MTVGVLILLAYLLGSISFGVIASRIFRLPDPRTYGSGNPGATNVLRSGKKKAAAFTLLGDAGKGWLSVAGAQYLAAVSHLGNEAVALAALAVFLGHLFPRIPGIQGRQGGCNGIGRADRVESVDGFARSLNLAGCGRRLAFFFTGCVGGGCIRADPYCFLSRL